MRDDSGLLQILADENPWWQGGGVPARLAPAYRRRDFFPLRKALSEPRITALVGPRQVGKTTLLYQLIQDLLSGGLDPKRVVFLALDFPRLAQTADDPVSDALDLYADRILGQPLRDLKAPVFIFLDEVAKQEGWHRVLKGWHDRRLSLKFTVSDSSLASIRRGAAESLVGRIDTRAVLPMKFVDALMFHQGREEYNNLSLTLREALLKSVRDGAPDLLLKAFRRAEGRLAPHARQIAIHLESYLCSDGYPELLQQRDWPAVARRLREYVDMVFSRDLLRVFEIRNPRALHALVGLLADQTGSRFDYAGLARKVELSTESLKEYLDHLEGAYLITRSEFHTASRASRLRKQRKVYFGNIGLANCLTGHVGPSLFQDKGYLGRLVETLVADHCLRLMYALEPGTEPRIAYWRNYRGQEVDIVLPLRDRPLPVEVKYQPRITPADRRPLIDFLEETSGPFGIIVTRQTLSLEDSILSVPLPLFLLAA